MHTAPDEENTQVRTQVPHYSEHTGLLEAALDVPKVLGTSAMPDLGAGRQVTSTGTVGAEWLPWGKCRMLLHLWRAILLGKPRAILARAFGYRSVTTSLRGQQVCLLSVPSRVCISCAVGPAQMHTPAPQQVHVLLRDKRPSSAQHERTHGQLQWSSRHAGDPAPAAVSCGALWLCCQQTRPEWGSSPIALARHVCLVML